MSIILACTQPVTTAVAGVQGCSLPPRPQGEGRGEGGFKDGIGCDSYIITFSLFAAQRFPYGAHWLLPESNEKPEYQAMHDKEGRHEQRRNEERGAEHPGVKPDPESLVKRK